MQNQGEQKRTKDYLGNQHQQQQQQQQQNPQQEIK